VETPEVHEWLAESLPLDLVYLRVLPYCRGYGSERVEETFRGEDNVVNILKRATGNMQSARAELATAIRSLENENVGEANLALCRATASIRKAFGGIADCIIADFDKDEGEPPSWWK
jgi:hypothetical protein